MITRWLEKLDDAASTIVPVAYLVGLLLGTMSYFAGLTLDFGVAVGVALAFAAELHSFLEQRRVRALWAQAGRARDAETQERLARQLRAHVVILCALVAFSAVNATAFAAETWTPAPGFLPTWLQIGLRGCIVPLLFLATGALSPLHSDTSDELMRASRAMQQRAVRATVKQWNARIERARRAGVDLAPVAISLLLDGGDAEGARRVQLIADGLAAAEGRRASAVPATLVASVAPQVTVAEHGSTRPPTGPGSPTAASVRPPAGSRRAHADVHMAPALELLPAPPTPRKRTAANRSKASVEARVRRVWQPGMSSKQLARVARISDSTASKWHALLVQEEGQAAR